jgi:hypothetical protein
MTAKAYPRNMLVHTCGSEVILDLLILHRLCFLGLSTRPVRGSFALLHPHIMGCRPASVGGGQYRKTALAGGGSRQFLCTPSLLVCLLLASFHHPEPSPVWEGSSGGFRCGPLSVLCLVGLRHLEPSPPFWSLCLSG